MIAEQDLKRRLSFLILGQRGGQNRVQILQALKERPYNLNQLAETLKLNYRTVKHHVDLLMKHEIIHTSNVGTYGQVYFICPELDSRFTLLEEVAEKLAGTTASPKFFQNVIEQTNDAIAVVDKDLEVLYWNDSAARLLGYSQEETIGRPIPVFKDKGTVKDTIAEIIKGKPVSRTEAQLISKDGGIMEGEMTIDGIRTEDGKITGFSIIFIDNTERKRALEELRRSEQRYALAQKAAGILSWEWDLKTDRMTWSEEPSVLLGKGAEVKTFKQLLKLIPSSDKAEVERTAKTAIKTGKAHSIVHRINRTDGTIRWISQTGGILKDKQGKPKTMLGIVQDVTEQREAESKHIAILETAIDGFAILDKNGHFREVNDAFSTITGFSKRELLSMSAKDVVVPGLKAEIAHRIKEMENVGYDIFETRISNKADMPIDIEVSISYLQMGEGQLVTFIRDISARKKREDAMVFQAGLLSQIHDAVVAMDNDHKVTYWSKSAEEMFGWKKKDVIGKDLQDLWQAVQEDTGQKERFENLLDAGSAGMELMFMKDDGSYIPTDARSAELRDEAKNIIGYLMSIRDMTEFRRSEKALRESEERLRSVLKSSLDVVYRLNLRTGKYEYFSPASVNVYGYTPEEMLAMAQDEALGHLHPDDAQHVKSELARINKEGKGLLETRWRCKDGNYHWLATNISIVYDENGKPLYRDGVVRDITERKKAETEIRRMASYPNLNPNPVLEFRSDGQLTFANDASKKIARYLEQSGPECFLPRDASLIFSELSDSPTESIQDEVNIKGRSFLVIINLVPGEDRLRIYGMDITKRRRAEAALREVNLQLEQRVEKRTKELVESNKLLMREMEQHKLMKDKVLTERQRFNSVLEEMPAYIILLTPDYHVPFANKFFRERFGESKGRKCYEYLFHRDSPCDNCQTYDALKFNKQIHWEWEGPDGHIYDIYDQPFKDSDGSLMIMEMGIDITASKKLEKDLKREKDGLEALLKEKGKKSM